MFRLDGSFQGLSNDRAQPASFAPPSVRHDFFQKKIKDTATFSFTIAARMRLPWVHLPRFPPTAGLL
jgi:hypothetical protein